jgi:hypothetical protein
MKHTIHLHEEGIIIEYNQDRGWDNKRIELPYQTREGEAYGQSIKDFKDAYNKLFEDNFGYITKKIVYDDGNEEEVKETIREELDERIFDWGDEYFDDRDKFYTCKTWVVAKDGCSYYYEHYYEGHRAHYLDMVRDAEDFKGKRFWTKTYLGIRPHLHNMDEFVEDLFSDNYIRNLIYTKARKEKIKNKEYTIWLEQENARLEQINYDKMFPRKTKNQKKQFCYILKDENIKYEDGSSAYKIGKSSNPENREKTLQAEKPTLKLIKQFKKDLEKELHYKYKEQNIRGEWFKLYPSQIKYICTHYE